MKNAKLKIAVLALLIIAIAAVQLFLIRKPQVSVKNDDDAVSVSDASHSDISSVKSETDTVSVSDTAAESETDAEIPVVIELKSLEGTETARKIDKIASDHSVAGLSVAVIKNGQVAYHYEYGYADVKAKREITVNTKFRIASLSKVFTSMMAMKLSEDGKLDLDKHIGTILKMTVRNPKYKKTDITTRMLLTHTASFTDRKTIFSAYIRRDFADEKSFTSSRPGKKFNYTNFGMGVAGAVVEKASGQKLTDYAQSAFFDPMGIDAGYDGTKLNDKSDVADCMVRDRVEKTAKELVRKKETQPAGQNHSLGAGGLLISSVDMAKVTTILINGGVYEDVRYLSEDTLAEFHTPHIETSKYSQCIGIRKSEKIIPGRTMYFHTGAAYGVFSLMAYDLSDGSGAVILSTGSKDYSDENGIRTICSDILENAYSDLLN